MILKCGLSMTERRSGRELRVRDLFQAQLQYHKSQVDGGLHAPTSGPRFAIHFGRKFIRSKGLQLSTAKQWEGSIKFPVASGLRGQLADGQCRSPKVFARCDFPAMLGPRCLAQGLLEAQDPTCPCEEVPPAGEEGPRTVDFSSHISTEATLVDIVLAPQSVSAFLASPLAHRSKSRT